MSRIHYKGKSKELKNARVWGLLLNKGNKNLYMEGFVFAQRKAGTTCGYIQQVGRNRTKAEGGTECTLLYGWHINQVSILHSEIKNKSTRMAPKALIVNISNELHDTSNGDLTFKGEKVTQGC